MVQDPFADLPESDRTYIRPRPGSRGARAGSGAGSADGLPLPPVSPGAGARGAGGPLDSSWPSGFDEARDAAVAGDEPSAGPGVEANRLIACAQPLLASVAQLRSSPRVGDTSALREQLAQAVARFERDALAEGLAKQEVIAARYILCTFVDETAAGTPWGSGGVWAREPLLVRFHNEAWGGEKAFALLSRLAEQPKQNQRLLELIWLCLALGFEGKYRVVPGGLQQLDQLRERLYRMIREQLPMVERTLASHWQPARVAKRRLLDGAPLWALIGIAGIVSLATYFVYSSTLANSTDPLFASIQSIRLASQPPPPPVATLPPAASPRLAQLLAPDIAQGSVDVKDLRGQSIVTLTSDKAFEPGSAQLSPEVLPALDHVARALAQFPGAVTVAGHTDSQPIRSARFPSNWHLSNERAQAVSRELARVIQANRLKTEGRADTEPIADNTSPAGRARNRRVEITLAAGR